MVQLAATSSTAADPFTVHSPPQRDPILVQRCPALRVRRRSGTQWCFYRGVIRCIWGADGPVVTLDRVGRGQFRSISGV